MKLSPRIRAITLREPQLGQVVTGALTCLRRPISRMSNFNVGELHWVREPFHLEKRFNPFSPSAAIDMGAKPLFVTDFEGEAVPDGWGYRRFARTLLRTWHRQHLQILDVRMEPLHAITDAEIRAEGFEDRTAYRIAWDANLSFGGTASRWSESPHVHVLRFEWIAEPVNAKPQLREPAHA